MGLFTAALRKMVMPVMPAGFWPQDYISDNISPLTTSMLVAVNAENALTFPAMYAAVRALSEDTAKLPLIVYRRLPGGGRERAPDHPTYRVLHDIANPEMTAFIFRETLTAHLLTWGNAYAEIQRNGIGDLVALWPLRPDRMTVRRGQVTTAAGDYPLEYVYQLPGGGGKIVLPPRKIFHIPGLGYDGRIGYGPVTMFRRALALGMAAQEYGERTFINGARPGIILKHPKVLNDTQIQRIRESWIGNHEGLANAQRTAILEEGMDVSTVGFPPEEAQFLQTRQFQVNEVARVMRIPPHKIGDLTHATFSNIEQQALEYVTDALSGWTTRWEQQIRKDLITEPDHYAEHLFDALLRGDAVARATALNIQRNAGVINADEWREIENRNPLPNGDGQVFLQPLNMTSIGQVPPGAEPELLRPPRGLANPAAEQQPPPIAPSPKSNGHRPGVPV